MRIAMPGVACAVRGALACALTAACSAALADPPNLEPGLPTEVADERTLRRGELQLQLLGRLDRARGAGTTLQLEPQLQLGVTDRLQATAGPVGTFGSADRSGSGDLRVGATWRVLDEDARRPGLAAAALADLPSGRDSRGVDTALRLIVSRTLGPRPDTHRIHANLERLHDASAEPDARPDRWRGVIAWSTALSERTTVVADAVREQRRERGQSATIAELGLRREVVRDWTLSLGGGLGRGGEAAPRWRLVAGLERDL